MKEMHVKITLIDEMLGTSVSGGAMYDEWIARKAPDAPSRAQEVEAIGVAAVVDRATTVFPRDAEGNPGIWDYQVRGFFKAKCGALRRIPGKLSVKCRSYKRQVDELIFVEPRFIALDMHGGSVGCCQRPLRALTPRGEAIAVASSETVPEGTTAEFTVKCFVDSDADLVREWLDMGEYNGMLQWRNSGKGRFLWVETDENGEVVGGNAIK